MPTPVKRSAVTRASGRTTAKGTKPPAKKKAVGVYTDDDGEQYHLSGKVNTFLLLKIQADTEDQEFNGADIYRLIIGMVTDKDRSRFISKLSRNADFDAEALNKTMIAMLEVAAGRNPSSTPSGSGGTASRNTSRELSAAT